MAKISVTVDVQLKSLERLRLALKDKTGEIGKAFQEWGAIYSSYIRKRFVRYSRGGGDWKPLSKATLAGRRKGKNRKKVVKAAILRDTNMLFAHLNPLKPSQIPNLSTSIPHGIRVNYGSTKVYPQGATITEIINYHDRGGPRLPQRKIFVKPDARHIKLMGDIMEKAIEKELAG